jgi:molecular chaperone GrpE
MIDPETTSSNEEMIETEVDLDEMELDDFVEPTDPMDELLRERDDLKDQLMRHLAEFQNFRRRVQTEKEDLRRYATESLVTDLLPVLDNFERTLVAAESGATLESLVEGVRMVERQLRAALADVQVARIPCVGQAFDPLLHEAIATDEGTDVVPDTITFELEAGYKMGDKIIRPARVRVAK